jgi:hypothetical protein
VRDVGKVNLSLLIKWRWRLIQRNGTFWKDILSAKYGAQVCQNVHWIGSSIHNGASSWWKDICSIDIREDESWFAQNLSRKIGNGLSTRFWLDCWLGDNPLSVRYPRLFSISAFKEGVVGDFWKERERWRKGEWG